MNRKKDQLADETAQVIKCLSLGVIDSSTLSNEKTDPSPRDFATIQRIKKVTGKMIDILMINFIKEYRESLVDPWSEEYYLSIFPPFEEDIVSQHFKKIQGNSKPCEYSNFLKTEIREKKHKLANFSQVCQIAGQFQDSAFFEQCGLLLSIDIQDFYNPVMFNEKELKKGERLEICLLAYSSFKFKERGVYRLLNGTLYEDFLHRHENEIPVKTQISYFKGWNFYVIEKDGKRTIHTRNEGRNELPEGIQKELGAKIDRSRLFPTANELHEHIKAWGHGYITANSISGLLKDKQQLHEEKRGRKSKPASN